MNILDMRTVLFSYVISNALCAAVMTLLWLRNRRHSPEVVFWLADFVMQLLAVLLVVLRGMVPGFASMVVSNALVIGGTILLYMGLERYVGKTSSQRHNFILLTAFIAVHTYFALVQPNLLARNLNLSLSLLAICSQGAWLMLHRVDAEMRPDTRPVGVIFGAYSLVSVVRVFADLAVPPGNDLFKSGLYDTLVVLIYQMLFIGLTFALFLMVNRRLFAALERDITARTLAEQALRRSEEKLSSAFHNIPDGIVITSITDGRIIEANESFFRIAGFTREETLGRTTIELNLWGSLAERNRFVEELQTDGRALNFETSFRKKSGELFTGLMSGETIELREGTCILSVIQDISARKQAEARIAAQLEDLRRWHEATLGRETRILELKREVNELLAQAGESPRYPSAEEHSSAGAEEA